jgi:ABC-type tungstate transport system substrate-binding protein
MTYRDDDAVLRERIERLELSLAKSAGRAMLLAEERDALHAELATLTRDPKALARVRGRNQSRSALFVAMRIFGLLGVGAVVVPMLLGALAAMVGGEPLGGLLCALVPMMIVGSVLLLKMPDIVTALELRVEKKQRERRARELSAPQVRVATDLHEEVAVEASAASMRSRR